MTLSLVTPPATEPLTLQEALDHLRLEQDAPDAALVTALIQAAREYAETRTARQFITATWRLTLDRFPCRSYTDWGSWPDARAKISLPRPPLQSVSSVAYLDPSGAPQTWATDQYVVLAPAQIQALPGQIYPALGVAYPATAARPDAVTITFVAGYGAASAVPRAIKQALLLLIGAWYEQREAVVAGQVTEVPLAVDALLGQFTLLSEAIR